MEKLKRTVARLLAERRARRAERELTALDDRLLADIGLTRAQVWSAVRESVDVSVDSPLFNPHAPSLRATS